jgi:hypothetical protein
MDIGDLMGRSNSGHLPFDEAYGAYTGRVVDRQGRGKQVIAVAADRNAVSE